MKLAKSNVFILIITIINVIVLSVFTTVLIVTSNNQPPPDTPPVITPPDDEPPVVEEPTFDDSNHKITRDATPSLSLFLDFDLSLGGTGEDTLGEVFDLDMLYLFGDTTSTNFDFSRLTTTKKLFLARMEKSGRLLSVRHFGTSGNDTYVASCLLEDHFAVLADNDLNNGGFSVTLLNLDGTVYKSKEFGTNKIENARAIRVFADKLVVVSEITDAILGKKEISIMFLDSELNQLADRRPIRTASLNFVDIFPFDANGMVMVANAFEGMISYSTLYYVRQDVAPIGYDQMKSVPHLALDVIPHNGEFLMLYKTKENNGAFCMTIKRDLMTLRHLDLQTKGVESGSLIFGSDMYYAHLSRADDGVIVPFDLQVTEVLTSIPSQTHFGGFFSTPTSSVVLTSGAKNQVTALVNGVAMSTISVGAPQENSAVCIVPAGASAIIFAHINQKGEDVSSAFYKQDIWIGKLSL